MLILAKLAGILVMVWFFLTGKKLDQPPVKWAVIGLIGYWLAWWIGNKALLAVLTGMFTKSTVMAFIMSQLPVVAGVAIAFLVRKKLISDAEKNNKSSET